MKFEKFLNEKQMKEETFWKKVKTLDNKIKKVYKKEIDKIINSNNKECSNYNEWDDFSYNAMENAMPKDNNFTKEVLNIYAGSLDGIIEDLQQYC